MAVSIEVQTEEVEAGRWRAHYRVIKDGVVVAKGVTTKTWSTEKEALWNGERYAQVKHDGA